MKRFVLIIAAVLLACAAAGAAEMFTLKAPGEKTIAVSALTNGMQFKGYEGRPLLLNFFGKNCRYCKREIPHLAEMKKKYGEKIGIIGVHVQERMNLMERDALQQKLGINYPIFEYDDNMAVVRHIASRAGYQGSIPFNIFFNGEGEVVDIIPGYLGAQDLETIFSELLNEQ